MMIALGLTVLTLAGGLLYEWRRQKLSVAVVAAMPPGSRLRDHRRNGTVLEVTIDGPEGRPGPGRAPAGRAGRGPRGRRPADRGPVCDRRQKKNRAARPRRTRVS